MDANRAKYDGVDARGSSSPLPLCPGARTPVYREHFPDREGDSFAQCESSPQRPGVLKQLLRTEVAEDGGHSQQTRFPTVRMKMMLDVLAMVVGLLVLANKVGRQSPTTPLASVWLLAHPRECSLEVLRRQVMSLGKTR
ncbi:MAG: hypothetical protein L0Z50_34190 [Verrucomicrobiales bacterium]|nr:hypothetical protein [Verrucomicrobiales bacterium]